VNDLLQQELLIQSPPLKPLKPTGQAVGLVLFPDAEAIQHVVKSNPREPTDPSSSTGTLDMVPVCEMAVWVLS
jgi:hypothetical protein